MNTWEKVYIFISSTFSDMHAERDYLVKNVFPELSEWCEKRKLKLIDIAYVFINDFSTALTLHHKLYSLQVKVLGPTHPETMETLGDIDNLKKKLVE